MLKKRKHKYIALDYVNAGVAISPETAYCQALQSLDVAAQQAENKKDVDTQIQIAQMWLSVAINLKSETEEERTVGFGVK